MSVLAVVAGLVLVFMAVFSTDPPLTYAWAAGVPLILAGLSGEVRLSRKQRRRVPVRTTAYRVADAGGFNRGGMVELDGRPHRIVAADTLTDTLYLEPVDR